MQAIFELAIFAQNNVGNYELLKIYFFFQKKGRKQPDKIFSLFDLKIALQRALYYKFT